MNSCRSLNTIDLLLEAFHDDATSAAHPIWNLLLPICLTWDADDSRQGTTAFFAREEMPLLTFMVNDRDITRFPTNDVRA